MMLKARVLSRVLWFLIAIWIRTIRVRYVGREIVDRLREEKKNFIYGFWHGRLLLLMHRFRNSGVVIPVSESRDGEILARIMGHFGFETVRGSSKRKGRQALLGMVDALRKDKLVAIAVDGPRGPAFETKEGILYLAGKLKKPIVPVVASAEKARILHRTWERLLIPMPFSRGVIMFGEPIWVHGIAEDELHKKRKEFDAALNGLMERADRYFTEPQAR